MFLSKCKMAILLISCMTFLGASLGPASLGQASAEPPKEPPPPAEKAAASVSGETEKPRPEPGLYEVSLKDGRQLSVRLLTEEIEIITDYGKLKVPVADIRRIDLGLRYPEGVRKQVEEAVARLGHDDFKVREAAGQELLRYKALAYPALRRALQSQDAEIKWRATQLIRQLKDSLPAEQLRVREHDLINTRLFPIVGRIEGLVLKGRSPASGEVHLLLADIWQVSSGAAEQALLGRVRAAVRAGRKTESEQMGYGSRKERYQEVPESGALLIGFEVTYASFDGSRVIQTVRPIFQTAGGRVSGTTHGVPGESVSRVEAKPGFAVGAVTIKAGAGVDGMSVTFMAIQEDGLDPNRAYESKWLGGKGGYPPKKLGGSGAPVVGIFGRVADGPRSPFIGLGLVTASVEETVAP
jgi:hypothetical protein